MGRFLNREYWYLKSEKRTITAPWKLNCLWYYDIAKIILFSFQYSHPPLMVINWFHETSSIINSSDHEPSFNICFAFHFRAKISLILFRKFQNVTENSEQWQDCTTRPPEWLVDLTDLANIANARALAVNWPTNDDSLGMWTYGGCVVGSNRRLAGGDC
jgi:hypothetical protein